MSPEAGNKLVSVEHALMEILMNCLQLSFCDKHLSPRYMAFCGMGQKSIGTLIK